MSKDSPLQARRRANLRLAMAPPTVGGPAELARLLGFPKMKSHLSNIKAGRRGMGDDLAQAIEAAIDKPPGWMDQHHPHAGETPAEYKVAHDMSHHLASDDLPMIKWEDLMELDPVPDLFRTILNDDALAPDLPRGTEVLWTTRRRISPGRAMLVRDQHGHVHARICHQGNAPGQWRAIATNAAFLSYDSGDIGVSVVAVYKGRLEPDDA